jgi:hypothetical protein
VPWFDPSGALQDSALYSLGTVPGMSAGATYPASAPYLGVGPKARILSDLQAGNGWGDGCSDFALQECKSDTDCPARRRSICVRSVCLQQAFNPTTGTKCYRHDMCPAQLLCDGAGECVQPEGYLYYLNNVTSQAVEATVYAEACDETNSAAYYTDGASPWEYVPDWLQGHGMCSNKNWYRLSLAFASASPPTFGLHRGRGS